MYLINEKLHGTDVYKLDSYSPRRILNMLEKIFMFQLEQAFLENYGHQMKLSDFVMTFLTHVKHQEGEEIFITSGLIDLFKDITLINGTDQLKWEHFTTYMIESVVESDMEDFAIPSKYISKLTSSKFDNIYKSNELSDHTPIVMGGSDHCLRRFGPSTKIMDSIHHSQGIKKIEYIPDSNVIGCLDNLTDYIKMYDEQCNLIRELGPQKENPNLDNAILYFAYSNTEKRIGACLHDFKLCFWDHSDNFTFEK